jgi:hypothetical protein
MAFGLPRPKLRQREDQLMHSCGMLCPPSQAKYLEGRWISWPYRQFRSGYGGWVLERDLAPGPAGGDWAAEGWAIHGQCLLAEELWTLDAVPPPACVRGSTFYGHCDTRIAHHRTRRGTTDYGRTPRI